MEQNKGEKHHVNNIILLGLVSCFADISAEMVYPILPLYLTAVLGATPAVVGVIEGIAESLSSLLKVFSGYLSDKYKRKKPLAFIGYATGVLYKLSLLFAGSWLGILIARIVDRFGKGIRTAPRDVMVAESAENGHLGKSFGIHKALDMLGSAVGILLSFLILKFMGDNIHSYKIVFIVSLIPIIIALSFFPMIKERRDARTNDPKEKFWKNKGRLGGQLKLYLVIVTLFTLGNSSNSAQILWELIR